MTAMATPNPRLKDIKAPVLIVTGDRDYVSDYRKYIPNAINTTFSPDQPKQKKCLKEVKLEGNILRKICFQMLRMSQCLLFPKGHHSGSTDIRINQVARCLKNLRKNEKTCKNNFIYVGIFFFFWILAEGKSPQKHRY